MSRLSLLWAKVPDRWKAALHTAWIAAIATFAPSLFGWLKDVQEWAGSTGRDFPAVTPIGKAAAAALVGVVGGVVNLIFRSIVPPPQYGKQTTITLGTGETYRIVPTSKDSGLSLIELLVGGAVLILLAYFLLR